MIDLLRRGRAELQGLDPAPRRRRPVRDGAGVRPDRRQHLPRRALARAAVPHAPGPRLRRLPHAGRRACTTAARPPTPAAASAASPAGRRPGPRSPTGRSASAPASCARSAGDHDRAIRDCGMTAASHRAQVAAGTGSQGRPRRRRRCARCWRPGRVALVGASPRPGSFGAADGRRGDSQHRPGREVYLVNPRYAADRRRGAATRRWPTCPSRSTSCCSACRDAHWRSS